MRDNSQLGPVLVTGGAGFLGSHIVEFLLRQGEHVVLIDVINAETSSREEKRKNLGLLEQVAAARQGSRLLIYEIDIRSEREVIAVLEKELPTRCVHAAAFVMDRRSVEKPKEFIENNVLGTQCLMDAIRATGSVKHLIYVSSRSVYGEKSDGEAMFGVDEHHPLQPINAYGASKVAAEQICYVHHRLYGLTVTACRLFPVYGPRGRVDMFPRRLLEKILADETIEIYGDLEAMRDWLDVNDAVDGVLRALDKPTGFEIVNFGSGKSTALNDLIKTAEELIGRKAKLVIVPRPAGDARFVGVCDYGKASRLFGWRPVTGLAEGLKRTLEYMAAAAREA